jgi:hypothetical protein
MDSTLLPIRAFLSKTAAVLAAACAVSPALGFNHDIVVAPLAPGPFAVACSNLEQNAALIAPGASAQDYWEGRNDHYLASILANPQAALRFEAPVPDERSLYPGNAGGTVPYVAIVCHPTPRGNADASYTLPGTGDVIPHMLPAGAQPRLIGMDEYGAAFGIAMQGHGAPMQLPLIVYSHGLTGSPISKGYVNVMVELASQGFMVAAVFHGDPRFSRVRVEDLSDFFYLLRNFDRVAEMMLLRPVSLKTMTDVLLAHPGYAGGIDTERIGGFGASLGGEAMIMLLGAQATTTMGGHCSDPVHDARIRAAVGFVPYAGYSFLPAFCNNQSGAARVNRPFLAMSGTADTTAPIDQMRQALNQFQSSRYFVELAGGQHEFRPEDAGDLFTWMVTFFNAYLDVRADPGAMGRLIRMAGVAGGYEDHLTVDVHIPFANAGGEVRVHELYNANINHYYLTTDEAEVQRILAGSAGAGWSLTPYGFKAWPQMPSDTFTAVAPVCRFDLPRRGAPWSSFYTASATDCATLKTNRGWNYAGTPWYIQPVDFGLRCPFGFIGVNRAYNQGWMRNDSNHRYSSSDSTMREMEREGWIYEATVMCSRP